MDPGSTWRESRLSVELCDFLSASLSSEAPSGGSSWMPFSSSPSQSAVEMRGLSPFEGTYLDGVLIGLTPGVANGVDALSFLDDSKSLKIIFSILKILQQLDYINPENINLYTKVMAIQHILK